MVIRLLPDQIPMFWETIKFAVTRSNVIQEQLIEGYFIELLHSLLNSTSQCFVCLNEDRQLQGLLVSDLTKNKITGIKTLVLRALYSWSLLSNEEWQIVVNLLKEFTRVVGAKYVTFTSSNPRIWDLALRFGCREQPKAFIYEVGGE